MIIDAFLAVIYAFVYAITAPFRLAPIVSLPTEWTSAVTTASGYIASLNAIIPVTTLIAVLAVFLGYELTYFGMKLINWVIRKIPTIS
jgi:hypothetical protein